MAAKFFTGLPLDGPDPECVQGYGEQALAGDRSIPAASQDHSKANPTRNQPVMLQLLTRRTRPAAGLGVRREPARGFHPLTPGRRGPSHARGGPVTNTEKAPMKLENPWKQNPWFESVAVAQERARKRLPAAGLRRPGRRLRARPERGRQPERAFTELGLAPHVVGQQPERSQATTVFGQQIGAAGDHQPDRRPGRAPRR